MNTAASKQSRKTRKSIKRPMPVDPRQHAKAMFDAADKKIDEGKAAEKPAAQES